MPFGLQHDPVLLYRNLKKKQNTCLEKNNKCQQAFINIPYIKVQSGTVIDMLLNLRHLKGPLVCTEGCFFALHTLGTLFYFLNHCGFASACSWPRPICSWDLSGQCSRKSCDRSGVPQQCATHAWCTLGVVVRCFVRDWRQNRVWSCIELWCWTSSFFFFFQFFLNLQNCSCGENQMRDPVSLWCFCQVELQLLSVHQCLSDSGVWNACILLCMYIFFLIGLKKLMHFKNLKKISWS